jgi:hypothetical protein
MLSWYSNLQTGRLTQLKNKNGQKSVLIKVVYGDATAVPKHGQTVFAKVLHRTLALLFAV